MDFLDLLRTMARRWYVVLPVLGLTAGSVYWLMASTEPDYEANGMFIITQPGLVPGELADGSVVIPDPEDSIGSVPVLAAMMGSDGVRAELTAGSAASYELSPLSGTELLDVRASGPERDEIVPLLERVLEGIERRVGEMVQVVPLPEAPRELPAGADGGSWFTASTVVSVPSLVSSVNAPDASFSGRLLAEMMADPAARRDVLGDELEGTFEFSQDRRNPGPFLELTATSTGPEATLKVFDRAAEEASERLDALQSSQGTSASLRMVLQPLRRPAGAELVSGGRSRPLFTIAGLGGLAALGLALLVEALAGHRGRDLIVTQPGGSERASNGPGDPLAAASGRAVSGRSDDPDAPVTPPMSAASPKGSPLATTRSPEARSPGAPSDDTSPDGPADPTVAAGVVVPRSAVTGNGGTWFVVAPSTDRSAVVERPGDTAGSTG